MWCRSRRRTTRCAWVGSSRPEVATRTWSWPCARVWARWRARSRAVRLYQLAEMVRDRPGLGDVVATGDVDSIRAALEGDASEVGEAYRSLLFDYGYRGQGEVDPTNADWSEDPTFALSQVRSMLAVPAADAPLAHIARAV